VLRELSKEDKKLLVRTGGVGTARKSKVKPGKDEEIVKPEGKPERKPETKPEVVKPETRPDPVPKPADAQPAPEAKRAEKSARGKSAK
jgi:hypothetical protein